MNSKIAFSGSVSVFPQDKADGTKALRLGPDAGGSYSNANVGELVDKLLSLQKTTNRKAFMFDASTRKTVPLTKTAGVYIAFGKWDNREDAYAATASGAMKNKPYLRVGDTARFSKAKAEKLA